MIVSLPAEEIADSSSFHSVFQRVFGFPDFYGQNMNAWVDCMTYLDDSDAGMTSITVAKGDLLILRIDDAFDFRHRCPDQYDALVECAAFVNYRRVATGEPPVLALLLVGWADSPNRAVEHRQSSHAPEPRVD